MAERRAAESEAHDGLDVVENLVEDAESLRGPLGGEESVAIGGADGGQRRQVVGGDERVVGDLGLGRVDVDLAGLGGEHEHRPHAAVRGGHLDGQVRWIGIDVGEVVDVGERIRVVRQPGVDLDPAGSDGHERVPFAVERLALDHPGHRADRRSFVTTTRLPAVRDQCLAELRFAVVVGEHVDHHLAIPGLEHVERQHAAGEQHTSEREHGHHRHGVEPTPTAVAARTRVRWRQPSTDGPRSELPGPSGYVANRSPKADHRGRYRVGSLTSAELAITTNSNAESVSAST